MTALPLGVPALAMLYSMYKDGVTGTLRFFKKSSCRSDNEQIVKRIAALPFCNFIVEPARLADKIKPLAAVFDACDVQSNLLQR